MNAKLQFVFNHDQRTDHDDVNEDAEHQDQEVGPEH